ncbi:MAG: 50S ribosomal protein L35 [Candidatus Moranbacteria bacterium]|jgi:ribosomal protein L35|nr:50S ribosomal protein L35 [Candidatus Moranbacteria bacterium]
MPKLKTKKSVIKKVRITKNKKVIVRHTKQNHGNSKETGKFRRHKRNDQQLFKTDEKNILKAIIN